MNFINSSDVDIKLSKDYSMTRDVLEHIFEEHWAFAPENLIMAVNEYDDIVVNPRNHNGISYLLKRIPWSKNFFRVTVWDGWVVTFFERVSWWEDLYIKDLQKWQ